MAQPRTQKAEANTKALTDALGLIEEQETEITQLKEQLANLPEAEKSQADLKIALGALTASEEKVERLLTYIGYGKASLDNMCSDFMMTHANRVQPHTKLRWQQEIEGLNASLSRVLDQERLEPEPKEEEQAA